MNTASNSIAFNPVRTAALLLLLIVPNGWAQTTPQRPRIGAIRWDAWYDPKDGTVAQAVERSLAPAEFHYRMPFFGKETGPNSVRINGNSQEIMDREIACAAQAGLAYWAFCAYAPSSPLSNALHLYLSSARRSAIGFCLVTELKSSIDYFKEQTECEIASMREPGYMTVLNGRPLYYVLSSSDKQMANVGGTSKILEWVRHVRSEVQKSGHGNPYCAIISSWTQSACTRLPWDRLEGLRTGCLFRKRKLMTSTNSEGELIRGRDYWSRTGNLEPDEFPLGSGDVDARLDGLIARKIVGRDGRCQVGRYGLPGIGG